MTKFIHSRATAEVLKGLKRVQSLAFFFFPFLLRIEMKSEKEAMKFIWKGR